MESASILIGLDIGLVLAIVYVLDRNVFHAVDLIIRGIPVWIGLRYYQTVLRIRLWFDKQSLRPGPFGRYLARRELDHIINNPAYQEFFREQVPSNPLQKGDD